LTLRNSEQLEIGSEKLAKLTAPSEFDTHEVQRIVGRECNKIATVRMFSFLTSFLADAQWRTQEFCSGGQVQQIPLRAEGSERTGIWGR
jgi:hypothetical protein